MKDACIVNKAKAISAKLLELNFKRSSKVPENYDKSRKKIQRITKKIQETSGKTGRNKQKQKKGKKKEKREVTKQKNWRKSGIKQEVTGRNGRNGNKQEDTGRNKEKLK